MSDRIAIYIAMGDKRQIGTASRPLANTIYQQNCADLHTKQVAIPVVDDDGNPVWQTRWEKGDDGNDVEVPVLDEDGNPKQKVRYEDKVVGLCLKPFVVMAIREGRRVSRKQIMEERAAQAPPFPDDTPVEEIEAPVVHKGIVVGQDADWINPTEEEKAAAVAEANSVPLGERYKAPSMGPSELDDLAAKHIPDISGALVGRPSPMGGGGGGGRPLVPLIQSRSYSGHSWEWGKTEIDFDGLWEQLDAKGRAMLHDEAMVIVQNASPTQARDTKKFLVGPGDATYEERAKEIKT